MLSSVAASVDQSYSIIGPLDGATHVGTCGEPGEGAYVRIWLVVVGDQIEGAAYATHGCPSSQLAGAMTAKVVAGRTIAQAQVITGRDIEVMLGGLPPGKGRFADMAVNALRSALENLG